MTTKHGLAAAFILAFASLASPAICGDAIGVAVPKAWARASPGGATIGAAYVEIRNSGEAADKLVGVATPAAGRAEIHTHLMDNGVMRMRKLDALELAPGTSVAMGPGGHHLMLFDLKSPLKAGDKLPLTLTFEKAGTIQIVAEVLEIGSQGPAGDVGSAGHGPK
jgi:hypothetical protein